MKWIASDGKKIALCLFMTKSRLQFHLSRLIRASSIPSRLRHPLARPLSSRVPLVRPPPIPRSATSNLSRALKSQPAITKRTHSTAFLAVNHTRMPTVVGIKAEMRRKQIILEIYTHTPSCAIHGNGFQNCIVYDPCNLCVSHRHLCVRSLCDCARFRISQ